MKQFYVVILENLFFDIWNFKLFWYKNIYVLNNRNKLKTVLSLMIKNLVVLILVIFNVFWGLLRILWICFWYSLTDVWEARQPRLFIAHPDFHERITNYLIYTYTHIYILGENGLGKISFRRKKRCKYSKHSLQTMIYKIDIVADPSNIV